MSAQCHALPCGTLVTVFDHRAHSLELIYRCGDSGARGYFSEEALKKVPVVASDADIIADMHTRVPDSVRRSDKVFE